MSDIAIRIPLKVAENHKDSIEQLIVGIRSTASIQDLHEARARSEAIKAWAKVHGKAKEMRLDLLRIEVEALVRIVELGGLATLPTADQRAAEWLAAMSPLERTRLINESGQVTTARGMCQSIWREEEIRKHNESQFRYGTKLAETPQPPKPYDEAAIAAARDRATSLSGSLANIADQYIRNGVEFTIDEMADEVIADAALSPDLAEDEVINQGVRDVCRRAVKSTPPLSIDGTVIPRLITARNADNKFIRIPVLNATVAHLDDMIEMRREQIEQDKAALQKLEDFAALIRKRGGTSPGASIGSIIMDSAVKAAS